MKTLEIQDLPDEVFAEIEKLAQVRSQPMSAVAAEMLAQALTIERESALLEEIRAERQALAARGFKTTPEEIQAFKVAGRR